MAWLIILGLAASSSLDNLGVGISYGIRSIRVSFSSNLLISGVCLVFSYFGIVSGRWISGILPGVFPLIASALLLAAIGLRIIIMAAPGKSALTLKKERSLGISSILQNPELADMDKSKHISTIEALVLGAALSANALTNGLSAGLIGFSPLAISIAASTGSFITLWAGVKAGKKFANVHIGSFELGQFGALISGALLIMIAIRNFF
ncbi:MAG: sporulation membrane protein YtaF [Clostridiales bacterium]|jgi:putative sporulation protein YtaF|nr:sporulation membrane protein YtaF [Clostridiales bacterium]